MLEKGKNTYATITDADNYVNSTYRKYNNLRVIWSVLSEEEKTEYLTQSLQEIERLPFVCKTLMINQPLKFPRRKINYLPSQHHCYITNPYPSGSLIDDIPTEIINAQTENALAILQEDCAGNAKQSFGMNLSCLAEKKNTKLTSDKAYTMLKGWLGSLRV